MSAQGLTPQETRRVDFAAPTTIGDEVLGTDSQTGQGFTLVGAPGNAMIRQIINTGTATNYTIILKRDGKEVRRWPSSLLQSTLQGPVWPGFPLPVRAGQIQFYAVQNAGAVEAVSIDVIWANSLITVVA